MFGAPLFSFLSLLQGPVLLIKAQWWHSQSQGFLLRISHEKNTHTQKNVSSPNVLRNPSKFRLWGGHVYLGYQKVNKTTVGCEWSWMLLGFAFCCACDDIWLGSNFSLWLWGEKKQSVKWRSQAPPQWGEQPRLMPSLTFASTFAIRESRSQVDPSTGMFNRLHFESSRQFLTSSKRLETNKNKTVTAALCLTFFFSPRYLFGITSAIIFLTFDTAWFGPVPTSWKKNCPQDVRLETAAAQLPSLFWRSN